MTLRDRGFRQVRLGQWLIGAEAWLSSGAWDACSLRRTVRLRELVVLALDGSDR